VSSPTRPQLGQLLLEKGLLTEEELDRALELHEQTGKPLGEIITDDLRLVSVAAMRDLLVLQKRWRPLGQMLVERGIITADQLFEALHEQGRSNRPLGEVVRDMFRVSSITLGKVLEDQQRLELELDRGYTSGLRSALHERGQGRSVAAGGGTANASAPLGQRIAASSFNDAQTHLALKHVESSEKKLAVAQERLEDYRVEIVELREALADRQLTIIDLEQRVRELEGAVHGSSLTLDD
jgi:hypothetical protein